MATTLLAPEHTQLLRASAIPDDVAVERGYESVTDPDRLLEEGYADWQARLVPGLLIPIYDVFGENGSSQFRPDVPRQRDDKAIRYETPQGAGNVLDVHPRMTKHLVHPGIALFFTEGVRKGDAIASLGHPCVALSGVWNWRGANQYGGVTALPDFEQLALKERQVFLVFDSDARTNVIVQRALARLRDFLKAKGASVTILLPPSPNGEKVGVDDYLGAGGDWQALFSPAHYFEPDVAAPAGMGWSDGGSFLFDIPEGVPAVWGSGKDVLMSRDEPLMIAGPQGVRKTTTGGHVAYGLCGVPGFETVYGLPITPASGKVVYLALDRPRQIARCLRRLCPEEYRGIVAERLDIWQGPLPFNVVKTEDDGALADWLLERDASHVIIDSLKDIDGKLSDEEVGAKLTRVFQRCIAVGIQVIILHHNRKATSENKRPKSLADVHGSENLTRGIGSVICLFGAAGDEEIELAHLKQPAEVVGPFVLQFDPDTGRGDVARKGQLAKGAKAERARAVRDHFMQCGGVGTTLTKQDLVDAGLGSKRTLQDTLSELVDQGWLTKDEGVGQGRESTWTLRAPMAEGQTFGDVLKRGKRVDD